MTAPAAESPAFLITIDTEGDNLWAVPAAVTTENARYLPRFQQLCERHGLKPTWLTNYEMAESPFFYEFGRDVLQRGAGEIGMHLHAWNSPPITEKDLAHHAYLIEYPEDVMSAKIKFMTELLEERFERKMLSHRAGRWALNSSYARLLVQNGYRVDCSVTPHVTWTAAIGAPDGSGGTDYTTYPSHPYFMDLDRIDREGNSPLLEIPVSIVARPSTLHRIVKRMPSVVRRAVHRRTTPQTSWLRPNGQNRDSMLAILNQAIQEGWQCVEFMLHSSELMAAGSPTFQTGHDIESLYDDLEALFANAAERFLGKTLSDFYAEHKLGKLRSTVTSL